MTDEYLSGHHPTIETQREAEHRGDTRAYLTCSCGWCGPPLRRTREAADGDRKAHLSAVREKLAA